MRYVLFVTALPITPTLFYSYSATTVTYPKSILPSKKSGSIVDVPLKYKPIANTDVPARHMDENNIAPT